MAAQPAAPVTRTSAAAVEPAPNGCAAKRGTVFALIVLARPWQWIKNGLVLAALVFSHRLFRPRDAVLAAVALAAFCALSSFAYVVNDIADRAADRLNQEKRDRPLACGDLTIAQAACFATALGAIATLLSAALGFHFLGIAALYVALQFGYSLWAKRFVVLDVVAIAVGFVLRAFGGGVAIGAEVSPWLIFMTFVLATLLALGRRRHELVAMRTGATAHRGVLAQYTVRLIDQMLTIFAGATLVSYMIYTASTEVEAKLGTRYLYLTVPLVAFGILRYLYLLDARNEGGDPARLLIRDIPLLATVLLWIAADVVLLYL
jgi:4-hydroxybenzoate polyprenyltransferase